MKIRFLHDKGFCKVGDIIDVPDERARQLITEKVAEVAEVANTDSQGEEDHDDSQS